MCVNDERIIKTLISHQTALVSFFNNISLMMMRKVSSYLCQKILRTYDQKENERARDREKGERERD